jgi:mannosyltransferase
MAVIAMDSAFRRQALARARAATSAIGPTLAAIIGVAAGLRLSASGDLGLRLDEAQSLWVAELPLTSHSVAYQHTASLFQMAAADVHPPGYFLLLHWWIGVFGTQVETVRLPSELASLVTIPLLYVLATQLYGRRVGLLSAAFGALSPFWIWHAQEARMYAFVVLFAVAATLGLVLGFEMGRTGGWLLFAIATALGVYFHYFAFVVLAAQLVYMAFRAWRLERRRLLAALAALLAVAVLYAPWAWMLARYYRGAGDPSLSAPDIYTPLLLLSNFVLGYLNVAATSQVIAAWPLLLLVGLGAGVFGAHPSWRGMMLWTLLAFPVALAFAVSLTWRPVISARYLIIVTPALYILMAVTVDRLVRGRGRLIAIGLACAVMLAGLAIERTSPYNPAAENYRQAAAYVHAHAEPGDIVGLDLAFNAYAYRYYADDSLPLYAIPSPPATAGVQSRLNEAAIDHYVRSLAAGHKRLWMVYYLDDEGAAAVRPYLDYHSSGRTVIFGGYYGRDQSDDPASFANVQLVLYQLPNLPQQPVQVRPLTVDQLAWLAGQHLSTRQPDALSAGLDGQQVGLMSPQAPEPRPLTRWGFTALAQPAPDDVVTVFNPNQAAVKVQVQAHWTMGAIVTEFQAPAMSDVEFSLNHWDSRSAGLALTMVASLPVTVSRTNLDAGKPQTNWGYDATTRLGQRYDGQVWAGTARPAAPAQLVQLPCGGADIWTSQLQAPSGSFTLVRFLASGLQPVRQGTWSYDVGRGGVQKVASIPAAVLGYGNYEFRLLREGGGEPGSERVAYFGIGCTPPRLQIPAKPHGRGHKGGG